MHVKQKVFRGSASIILIFLVCIALVSCNLKNRIVLEGQGKGTFELSLKLPSYMLESLDILALSIPGGEEWLQPERITEQLNQTKDISDVKVDMPQKGTYQIRFRFANLSYKGSAQNFLQWREEGSTRLSIQINRKTYEALENRFPSLGQNPLLQIYGPGSTQGMSREDYLDMVEYSFGPQARKDLLVAEAEIVLELPGPIISQSGGKKTGSKTLELRLPLLDFLLLEREKRYSVVYR